jgi:hypothetical protein
LNKYITKNEKQDKRILLKKKFYAKLLHRKIAREYSPGNSYRLSVALFENVYGT